MDALLAANPDKMAKALADESPAYLAIDHPYGSMNLFDTGYLGGFGGWLNQSAPQGDNVDLKMFIGLTGIPIYSTILMDGNGKERIKITGLTRDRITNTITGGELKSQEVYTEANPLLQSTLRVERLDRSFSVGAHISHFAVDWFHAVTDDRPGKALFDRLFIAKDDLQVGDHIYLANHSIHQTRIGSTPWNGEHSLVPDPWNANPFQIRITGHGIPEQTVLQLTHSMLEEINVFLAVTRKIVDKWLALSPGRTPDSMSDGEASARQRSFLAQFLLRANPVQFNGKIRVFNMPALAYRRGGKNKVYPAYWVMDLEGKSDNTPIERKQVLLFDYDPKATKARPWKDPWPPTNPVAVLRPAGLAALGGEAKRHYAVSYIDQQIGLELLMPLYYPLEPHKGSPVRINFDDVKRSIFFGLADGRVFVTRPRVLADSGYLAHLKHLGAIPP